MDANANLKFDKCCPEDDGNGVLLVRNIQRHVGGIEYSSPIAPNEFVSRMNLRWQELNNTSNPALDATWDQLCRVFNRRILESSTTDANLWHCLSPATGTGKTQGVAVYLQLLIENRTTEFPGVLFVTNLKEEADAFEETVNELCGITYAYAFHSDKTSPGMDFLHSVPILIVTHSRYLRAMRDAGFGSVRESSDLFGYGNTLGFRRLVIVDEAIGLIRHHKISSEDLFRLKQGLTDEIRSTIVQERFQTAPGQPRDACEYVDAIHDWLLNLEVNSLTTFSVKPPRHIDSGSPSLKPLARLRQLMSEQHLDEILLGRKSSKDLPRLHEEFDKLIVAVESIDTANAAQVGQRGKRKTIFTSELLIPANAQGCVLLDATSNIDALGLFSNNRVMHERIPGARHYGNVTVFVSKNHRVGKQYWQENGAELSSQVLGALDSKFDTSDHVLVVCHKQVAHHFRNNHVAFRPDVATWGSIAGRNNWRLCNAVVIAGLQYRDSAHDVGSFICLQRDSENLSQEMNSLRLGSITADIIQAINRSRCRQAIDEKGGCARTEVFLLLPEERSANYICQSIAEEMPGIKIVPWQFDGATRKTLENTASSRLLDYASNNLNVGEAAAQDVRRASNISETNWKQLVRRHLKNPQSMLRQSLNSMGVTFLQRPNGRWYFEKE